jgi:hypothetical protein
MWLQRVTLNDIMLLAGVNKQFAVHVSLFVIKDAAVLKANEH